MAVAAGPRPGSVHWPWRYRTRQFVWAAVDFVFPPQCAGCGRPGQRFCSDCRTRLEALTPPLCDACGYPVAQPGRCRLCRARAQYPSTLAGIRSTAFLVGPLQKAVHQLKYHRDGILADSLAALMAAGEPGQAAAGCLVVPVPLAPARLAARGYNQAGLLARAYAELSGRRVVTAAARRVRNTETQVGLSPRQRRLNVAGAFEADRRAAEGRPIILVDDVCTTGATLEACADALRAAGAGPIWGLTLARARLPQGKAENRPSPTLAGAAPAGTVP